MDAVIAKYKVKAQVKKQTDALILQQQSEDVNELLSEAKHDAVQNELLERSRNVTELLAYKEKELNVPILKNIIPPMLTTKLVSNAVVESLFGSFSNSQVVVAQKPPSLKANSQQLLTIDITCYIHETPYKKLFRVASTKLLGLWAIGSENIFGLFDTMNGTIIESFTTRGTPVDICTDDFENLYVCYCQTIYKNENGSNFKSCFTAPVGWNIKSLAINRVIIPATSGTPLNLLMVLHRENIRQCKVVRVASGLSSMCEFQYDRNGMDLYNTYSFDFYLAENTNGDICVSDTTTLVVIDRVGNFRYRYNGRVLYPFDKPFTPRGVTTDSHGNILLADMENKRIHLLDQNGNFVRYITGGGSLDKVIDISCDDNEGVLVVERDTGKIKYIRYQ